LSPAPYAAERSADPPDPTEESATAVEAVAVFDPPTLKSFLRENASKEDGVWTTSRRGVVKVFGANRLKLVAGAARATARREANFISYKFNPLYMIN